MLQTDKSKINKDDRGFTITTKVLNQKNGVFVDQIEGTFDFTHVDQEDMVTLFELETEDGGIIILDLFQRDGLNSSKSTQVSTLTERGSSKVTG